MITLIEKTHHYIINAHPNETRVVDLLELDVARFIRKKNAEEKYDSFVAEQDTF